MISTAMTIKISTESDGEKNSSDIPVLKSYNEFSFDNFETAISCKEKLENNNEVTESKGETKTQQLFFKAA